MNSIRQTKELLSLIITNSIALVTRIYYGESQPPRRALTLLLLAALVAPLLLFGQPRAAAAARPVVNDGSSPISISSNITPPVMPTLPEAFAAPNTEETAASEFAAGFALPYLLSVGNGVANGYRAAANVIQPPAMPEGFSQAHLPTFGERVAAVWSADSTTASTEKMTAEPKAIDDQATSENNEAGAPVEPSAPPPPAAPATARFDFDGDGKADVSRYQPSGNLWTIKRSSNGSLLDVGGFGTNGAVVAPADYDGDGITDLAVWNQYSADWKILNSANGSYLNISAFGLNGDKVVSADYDGDGKADLALFRPSNGTWYIRRSSN